MLSKEDLNYWRSWVEPIAVGGKNKSDDYHKDDNMICVLGKYGKIASMPYEAAAELVTDDDIVETCSFGEWDIDDVKTVGKAARKAMNDTKSKWYVPGLETPYTDEEIEAMWEQDLIDIPF